MGKKGDAHAAWKQAMHIGGDIDVYMDIMAQFGCAVSDTTRPNAPIAVVPPVVTAAAAKINITQ